MPGPLVEATEVGRVFSARAGDLEALRDVSFSVDRGQTLAVIGESGAGKSTLTRIVSGLDVPTTGTITIDGRPPRIRRGRPSPVQMVFQNPLDALNPYHSVARAVGEPLWRLGRRERQRRVAHLLDRVGIDPGRGPQRPASFSGGQRQRIVLARALAAKPQLLLCDEPTSALDVSVQAQIINLLLELQAEESFACILVTHDLQVAKVLADDVLVLRGGQVIEYGSAELFFRGPSAAYSRDLLGAMTGHDLRKPKSAGAPT